MRDLHDARDVEIRFEMLREGVERRFDPLLVVETRIARAAEPRQESTAEGIAGEEAVEMAAGDAAVGRDGAVAARAEAQHRPRGARAVAPAEMHLVAAHGRAARAFDSFGR